MTCGVCMVTDKWKDSFQLLKRDLGRLAQYAKTCNSGWESSFVRYATIETEKPKGLQSLQGIISSALSTSNDERQRRRASFAHLVICVQHQP